MQYNNEVKERIEGNDRFGFHLEKGERVYGNSRKIPKRRRCKANAKQTCKKSPVSSQKISSQQQIRNKVFSQTMKRESMYEGTSLSPILNRVSAFTFPSLTTCFKRRAGIVRRTHSPVSFLSPTTNCISKFVSTRSGNLAMPYMNKMGKLVPIKEESVTIPHRPECNEHKLKKRKRCVSPKNGKRSRSRSPIGRRGAQDNSVLKSNRTDYSSFVKVKIVSPTLRGVSESVRLLRNGMFSFPTETMYTLVSFIEFRRRTKKTDQEGKSTPCQWQSLLDFKLIAEDKIKQSCHTHVPLLYVHSPTHACNYVSFSKRKTFVYKHPQTGEDENTERKFSAVTFSESYEVLNRLSSAFWPGPVTIFAPVKKIRSRSSSLIPKLSNSIQSSCASLTSLTSESSDDQPPNLSLHEDDSEGSVSVLPLSALVSIDDLTGKEGANTESHYVGMKCPSHPLARRILSGVYEDEDSKKTTSARKGRSRIPGAVMGFSASVLNNGSQSYSCKDVCSNLVSIQSQHDLPSNTKPTIHVMNGEDRREMFFVPAGQYCQNSEVSLIVDTPNRTVHIIRSAEEGKATVQIEGGVYIQADDVVKALHFEQAGHRSSVTARAITSVLHKWKVNEIRK